MQNSDHAARVTMRCAARAGLHAMLAFMLAACLLYPPFASAADGPGKRHNSHWHGYGFLPGYHPPEHPILGAQPRGPTYWYGGPGFYRGRWNGGGFGPCWTPTPIGPMWNCG